MRFILPAVLLATAVSVTACSKDEAPKPSQQADEHQRVEAGGEPVYKTVEHSNVGAEAVPARRATEDMGTLEKTVTAEKNAALEQLDRAETLKAMVYPVGEPLPMQECISLQSRIAKNYPLHVFEAVNEKSAHVEAQGINVCGSDQSIREGGYIQDARVKLHNGKVTSTTGLEASQVITLQYRFFGDRGSAMLEQFLINDKLQVIEHQQSRSLSGGESWELVAAMTAEGHILSRVAKLRPDQSQPYHWKGAVTFASVDGKIEAIRFRQNDGKGVEASQLMLEVPIGVQWTQYEVSPISRLGGIYLINNEKERTVKSTSVLRFIEKAGQSCAYGYIGYDNKGNSIRDFGDWDCQSNMDMNTSIH